MLRDRRRLWLAGLLVVVLLVLAACAPQQPEEAGVSEGDTAEEPIQPEEEPTAEPTEEATEEMTEEPTEEPTEEMVANSVEVEDQELGEDNTVVVPAVTSDGPGWMVIHADEDGGPGPVIGWSAVEAGENSDVEVELDPMGITETLHAMLHVDAGVEGEYEFPGDDVPAQDADGNVVMLPFAVSGFHDMTMMENEFLTVEDQSLSETNSVVVPRVVSNGPGWMVIHADDAGGPGPVIGWTAVEDGENTDVEVEIDPAGLTDTVHAMLHVDVGVEGEYEFPGDDIPAFDEDDNIIMLPFVVTSGGEGAAADGEVVVMIVGSRFDESEITVPVGTTVVWESQASLPHTVTADDGSFDSGTLVSGDTFSFAFEEAGEFPYYCAFHGGPGGAGMSGVITVES